MVPDFARVLVGARDLYISYNKIDNSREVTRNRPRKLTKRMWNDAPEWLASLCKLCILSYYSSEQADNRYSHHFASITFDAELPDDQFICLSILNDEGLVDLEKKRRTQVAEWIHAQATCWSKLVDEKNKQIRKKDEWSLSPTSETRLCGWSGDCIRRLSSSTSFKPTMDSSESQTAGVQITTSDVLLVIAPFFQTLWKCEESPLDHFT